MAMVGSLDRFGRISERGIQIPSMNVAEVLAEVAVILATDSVEILPDLQVETSLEVDHHNIS